MDALHSLMVSLAGPIWAGFLQLIGAVLTGLLPTLDMTVPLVIAWLAHRFVRNKVLADAFATGGGMAYAHMSAAFQAGQVRSLTLAKAEAVRAAQEALTAAATGALVRLSQDKLQLGIEGALGKLMASDPTISLAPVTPAALAAAAAPGQPLPTGDADRAAEMMRQVNDAVRTSVLQSMAEMQAQSAVPTVAAKLDVNEDLGRTIQQAIALSGADLSSFLRNLPGSSGGKA